MKITKFVHSCLLVEMPEPVNRTALFDPGVMSESALNVDSLVYLDDIIITHNHADHLSVDLIKKLVAKFPDVRITSTKQAVEQLQQAGITASYDPPEGITFFDAPHENVEPLFPVSEQIGVHYLNMLSHPGDSHSFNETRDILALPVTAPWGATVTAVQLALKLQPKFVIPIHDWHWRPDAQAHMYAPLEKAFAEQGITFIKAVDGEAFVLDV